MTIEYQAPTDLNGAYDPLLAQVDLTWTASVDGIPLLFTSNGFYAGDATSDHVDVIVIGDGGGGSSGGIISASSGQGGYGGGAGGISIQTLTTASLTLPVAVTVGQGGAGGASITGAGNSISGQNMGASGTGSAFGGYLTAGPGIGGLQTFNQGAGGTGTTQNGAGVTGGSPNTGRGASISSGSGASSFAGGAASIAPGSGGGGAMCPHFFFGTYEPASAGGSGQTSAASPSAGGIAGTGSAAASPGGAGAPGANGPSYLNGFAGGGGGGGGAAGGDSPIPSIAIAGTGGNGGLYGAGGGGGGAAVAVSGAGTVQTQGAGGSGAPGCVNTVTYWLHTHDPYYLVYRNGVLLGVTAQGATSFDDFSPLAGVNTYTVYASYDGTTLMSAASNPVTVTISSGKVYVSGKFSPANAFAPIMLINLKGVKPKFYPPVINPNMRSRR